MWEKRDARSSACIRREMLHVAVIPARIHAAAIVTAKEAPVHHHNTNLCILLGHKVITPRES